MSEIQKVVFIILFFVCSSEKKYLLVRLLNSKNISIDTPVGLLDRSERIAVITYNGPSDIIVHSRCMSRQNVSKLGYGNP